MIRHSPSTSAGKEGGWTDPMRRQVVRAVAADPVFPLVSDYRLRLAREDGLLEYDEDNRRWWLTVPLSSTSQLREV